MMTVDATNEQKVLTDNEWAISANFKAYPPLSKEELHEAQEAEEAATMRHIAGIRLP